LPSCSKRHLFEDQADVLGNTRPFLSSSQSATFSFKQLLCVPEQLAKAGESELVFILQ